MESVLVHNVSIYKLKYIQESSTALSFRIPAFFLNLLTCCGTTLYSDYTE